MSPEILLEFDAFNLNLYIQSFLLSHSAGLENYNNDPKSEVANQIRKMINRFPNSNIAIPTFTPNQTPAQYMNSVMTALNEAGDEWGNRVFPIWLHDLLLSQNLFRRAEFVESPNRKRPDPCAVIKKGNRKRDEYVRTFLHTFDDDINTEHVCIQLRRFLRYLHQKLGKYRLLNLVTGYHSVITKRSKTMIDLETFVITTPLQLDVHADIQKYVREKMPNKLVTVHFGTQIPGLSPIQRSESDRTLVAPPILPEISINRVERETEAESRLKDQENVFKKDEVANN